MCSDFDKAVKQVRERGVKPCSTARRKGTSTVEQWAAHLEYLKLRRERSKEKIKDYQRKYQWKSRYGIDPEQYEAALDVCNYTCQICGQRSQVRLAIDHCHETGANRGLLCRSCNSAIGMLMHSEFRLENALEYLRNWDKGLVAELLRREDLDDTSKRN